MLWINILNWYIFFYPEIASENEQKSFCICYCLNPINFQEQLFSQPQRQEKGTFKKYKAKPSLSLKINSETPKIVV